MERSKILTSLVAVLVLFVVWVAVSLWIDGAGSVQNESPVATSTQESNASEHPSGISLAIPAGLSNMAEKAYGQEIFFTLGNDYYKSLGNVGTTTIELRVTTGIASSTTPGRGCSSESYSSRGSASSTVVQLSGHFFLRAVQSDAGMSQFHELERYVQFKQNEDECRYIEFYFHTSSPGAYTSDPTELKEMEENNKKFRVILDQKKKEVFESIKIK